MYCEVALQHHLFLLCWWWKHTGPPMFERAAQGKPAVLLYRPQAHSGCTRDSRASWVKSLFHCFRSDSSSPPMDAIPRFHDSTTLRFTTSTESSNDVRELKGKAYQRPLAAVM